MSRAVITESLLTDIANAIREKLGVQTTYTPPQMAAAIESIPTGGITPTGTVSITQNGTHDVTQYANANVNVQPNLQSKTVTQNGTVTPDQGYDGLSSVVVNVSGGGGESVTIQAITEFTPNSNANTARSAGIQITPLYDLKCMGIRFWARDSLCNVYISDTSGNTIVSKQNATVTAGQWNNILFDAPVVLNRNTTYIIWGSNQSSAMRYVNASSLGSQFVTIGAAKYTTTLDTFPANSEPGDAKYGVNLLFAVSL